MIAIFGQWGLCYASDLLGHLLDVSCSEGGRGGEDEEIE